MKAKIAITIDSEILEKIEKMAEELGLNRSQLIENMCSVGLSDAKVLKAIGLLDLAKAAIRLKEKVLKISIKGIRAR
jgi:metal-responsive CopG/Arc/MetJ family transcriptional regulator